MRNSALRTDEDFEAFYRRHYSYIYRLCFSYLKDASDAEDAAEDLFVSVISKKISFNDEGHERKWLTVAAVNLCKNRLKAKNRKATVPIEDENALPHAQQSAGNDVLDAVLSLPPKYKDVIWLYYYEGYQTKEIAGMLRRPHSTVRGQIRDARNLLKSILGGKSDE